jgi:osmoprotectant transport system permease protein
VPRTGRASILLLLAFLTCGCDREPAVASKAFTESVILGEILAQHARANGGATVRHERELGGTQIVYKALLRGDVDVYPEYTGTIAEEILAGEKVSGDDDESLRAALARRGVLMSRPLGFNNTYAIGMRRADAERLGIKTISELAKHPQLTLGFSNEFLDRADGWRGLKQRYGLPHADVRGMHHDVAYRALAEGSIAATDLYSTDAEIAHYDLVVLADDLSYFPGYRAVLLYRDDLPARSPRLIDAVRALEGRIDERQMIAMNGDAKLKKVPEAQVASSFLASQLGATARPDATRDSRARRILRYTREHLALVGVSLAAAIAAGVPLGVLARSMPRVGQAVLATVAAIYTIPSLALLVFMIRPLGIGAAPATVALFLYSLLPIVRNTHAGLVGIPRPLQESAHASGLPPFARLRLVELPMALGPILAGIKTAAVINVGTATLGALIGAGGYGEPILAGVRLDDFGLILEGAVPAAGLALLVQGAFELVERYALPRGLRPASR